MAPGPRASFGMVAHRKRAVLFGGITDQRGKVRPVCTIHPTLACDASPPQDRFLSQNLLPQNLLQHQSRVRSDRVMLHARVGQLTMVRLYAGCDLH